MQKAASIQNNRLFAQFPKKKPHKIIQKKCVDLNLLLTILEMIYIL